jgi:hypothetical protein
MDPSCEIVSSMKGDVKGQSFTNDRRRSIGLDIQPQTTAVGSKSSVSADDPRERYVANSTIEQCREQPARAQAIPMPCEFFNHVQTEDRILTGVMKNVNRIRPEYRP